MRKSQQLMRKKLPMKKRLSMKKNLLMKRLTMLLDLPEVQKLIKTT